MNKTLEGMARAIVESLGNDPDAPSHVLRCLEWQKYDLAIRDALHWLADNISDEMVLASILLPNDPKEAQLRLAFKSPKHKDTVERARLCISRALRAAAGSALKAKP